ncbi:hypothetical protein AB0A77_34085 [Streptomyces varsoviensis]|uniref:hypothetical protein n=1 Tax=Streptomyces varsoviensis TaxID=67373 RepID=UPI0033E39CAC
MARREYPAPLPGIARVRVIADEATAKKIADALGASFTCTTPAAYSGSRSYIEIDTRPVAESAPIALPGEALAVISARPASPLPGLDTRRFAAEVLAHHARELAARLRTAKGERGSAAYDHETGPGMAAAADHLDEYARGLDAESHR